VAIFHNSIGSLTVLKAELQKAGVYDLHSVREVQDFQANYFHNRQEIIKEHGQRVSQERADLKPRTAAAKLELDQKTEDSLLSIQAKIDGLRYKREVVAGLFRFWLDIQIRIAEKTIPRRVNRATQKLESEYLALCERLEFVSNQFDTAVLESAKAALESLDKKKAVVDRVSPLVAGAIGEQKVVRALEALSDEFHVINDFNKTFRKAMYNQRTGQHIQSIQLDHVVVGPSGVFVIETKHWSDDTIRNHKGFSPVEQVNRGGWVLFTLLNSSYGKGLLGKIQHRWGHVKIPVRNLLVMTNKMPKQDFQYVKVLDLNQLVPYIEYWKSVHGPVEVNSIVESLRSI
jgi:hypothetical protein